MGCIRKILSFIQRSYCIYSRVAVGHEGHATDFINLNLACNWQLLYGLKANVLVESSVADATVCWAVASTELAETKRALLGS